MSPDPCDAREGEPGPGFVLPFRCGGFPTAEGAASRPTTEWALDMPPPSRHPKTTTVRGSTRPPGATT